jgi:hypothetical protein
MGAVLRTGVNVALHVDTVRDGLNSLLDRLFFEALACERLFDLGRPVRLGANAGYAKAR